MTDRYINIIVTTDRNVYLNFYKMKISQYFDTFIMTSESINDLISYHYYDTSFTRHHMIDKDIKLVVREFHRRFKDKSRNDHYYWGKWN